MKNMITNSLKVSKKYNKKHKNILKTIRNIIRRDIDMKEDYIESSYKDNSGKNNIMYEISDKGIKLLETKLKYHVPAKSLEKEYINVLKEIFHDQEMIEQYPIGKYKLDLYFPELDMIIEIDESHHDTKGNIIKDEQRMEEIVHLMTLDILKREEEREGMEYKYEVARNWIILIRIKEGELYTKIREIFNTLYKESLFGTYLLR